MDTLIQKSRVMLFVMFLCMSFSASASVESDAVKAAKGKTKEQVAAIVQAAAKANPALAASIALAVTKSQPAFAAAIAAAASKGSPANAAAIVMAVVKEVPKSASAIAKEVVAAVPSKAGAITNAAVRSAPDAVAAITEAVVRQVVESAAPSVAQPSTARSESTTNNISVTQNVITTNLENKIAACGTNTTCKVAAAVSAVQSSGTNNATLLSLLASAIIVKVQQISNDSSLITDIKTSTQQAAASAS